MDVIVESGQFLPRRAAVFGFQKSPLFNASIHNLGVSRIDGDVFHVAQVRRRGKEPLETFESFRDAEFFQWPKSSLLEMMREFCS